MIKYALGFTIFVVSCYVLLMFFMEEYVRWEENKRTCSANWLVNTRTLASDVCKNPYDYGQAEIDNCRRAAKESELSANACAAQLMWRHSEVKKVLNTVSDSPVMVFSLCAICIVTFIWSLFHSYNLNRTQQNMKEFQRESLMYKGPALLLDQQPVEQPKKKRKKVKVDSLNLD